MGFAGDTKRRGPQVARLVNPLHFSRTARVRTGAGNAEPYRASGSSRILRPMSSILLARDARLASHAREGFALALAEPEYRSSVLARLVPALVARPDDLWDAIPWLWAAALGLQAPSDGRMAAAVHEAAPSFTAWLLGEEPLSTLERHWAQQFGLAAGSTLRSHPFADLRSWSIRPKFAAS